MLTRANCFGVWASILPEWDPCHRFDEERFAKNVRTLVAAGVHAIRTNGTNTRDIVAQIEYCAKAGADAVMAAFPFWLEIGDREWLPLLQDSCHAAQSMGVLHYNTVRAKRVLHPANYAVWAREPPLNFIGSKSAMAGFGLWCRLDFESPRLVQIPMETSAAHPCGNHSGIMSNTVPGSARNCSASARNAVRLAADSAIWLQ